MPGTPFWKWLSLSEDGGAGGDAFFKSLRASGNLNDADILAREVIQNSWDSALKQRENIQDPGLEFRMVFEFKELKGEEKKKFVKNSALNDFQFPLSKLPKDDAYRIKFQSELNALKTSAPLRLLYCSDFGGHGLYGHPNLLKDSILYRALYYLGGPSKVQGIAGGNFGFGKGAFVRGSKLHIVFAHSTFDKLPNNEDKVQRRLVGCSFWDQFGDNYDGRGRFGVRAQSGPSGTEKIVPYEGTEAEYWADLLGFPARKIEGPEDFGASFMLVSPTVSPEELQDSIEQNWWPAIEEKTLRFNVQIKDYDGSKIAVRPRENRVAKYFIGPYISALDLKSEKMDERTLGSFVTNQQRHKHGVLYANVISEQVEDSLVDGREEHLVHGRIALIRSPRMVVSYKHYPISRARICGVFVADNAYDKALQATEPSLHYQWAIESSDDIKKEHTEAARVVMNGIKRRLNKWLEVLSPPPPREDTYVQLFADLLAPFMTGTNPPPPPPPPRYEPISIRFLNGPKPVIDKVGNIRTKASFLVKTTEEFVDESKDLIIGTEFQITEDDKDSGDSWDFDLTLSQKSDKAIKDGKNWRLTLNKGDEFRFEFTSDPYNANYSGKLKTFVLEGNG